MPLLTFPSFQAAQVRSGYADQQKTLYHLLGGILVSIQEREGERESALLR